MIIQNLQFALEIGPCPSWRKLLRLSHPSRGLHNFDIDNNLNLLCSCDNPESTPTTRGSLDLLVAEHLSLNLRCADYLHSQQPPCAAHNCTANAQVLALRSRTRFGQHRLILPSRHDESSSAGRARRATRYVQKEAVQSASASAAAISSANVQSIYATVRPELLPSTYAAVWPASAIRAISTIC